MTDRRSFRSGRLGVADQLEDVRLRFYEAVADPGAWRSVLLDVARVLKADGAAVFSNASAGGLGIHNTERVDALIDWITRQGPELINPRPERALRRASPGQATTESHLFSEWELKKLPFNAGMAEEIGLPWDAGGYVHLLDGQPVFLTAQRGKSREAFSHAELELVEALLPDLRQAAILSAALAMSKAEGMVQGFEHAGVGAALLDDRGAVLSMNATAQSLLGRGLRLERHRLAAAHHGAERELQRAISAALSLPRLSKNRPATCVSLPRETGRPLMAEVLAIEGAAEDFLHKGKLIVLLKDPDAGRSPAELALRSLFGLTRSEIHIAQGIAQGRELTDIAAQLGIRIATARVHLKSVMAKTDTHRQTELALLLSRLAAASSGET